MYRWRLLILCVCVCDCVVTEIFAELAFLKVKGYADAQLYEPVPKNDTTGRNQKTSFKELQVHVNL